MFKKLKVGIFSKDIFSTLKSRIIFFISPNRISIEKTSKIKINNSIIKNSEILIKGKNCDIDLGEGNRYVNCKIEVLGDNCEIKIGKGNRLTQVWLWVDDKGSGIFIGNDNDFTGKIQLAAIEGTSIRVGNDNLFSREIQISSGDSHSIIEKASGKRINPSKTISIGNHVWVGMHVTITKGVSLASNVIVGRGSIVTRSVEESNTAVAGIPAKIVKKGVDWDYEKLPIVDLS